jgi:succinate dehydrogenase flavin-adding protein (antitoxin of CptAB toxin-antitoxin module)
MELDQDDVRTKGEKKALAALLEQYDPDEMAELIMAYSKPLKAKMQELFPAQPTNENKKRMKVRMLRG